MEVLNLWLSSYTIQNFNQQTFNLYETLSWILCHVSKRGTEKVIFKHGENTPFLQKNSQTSILIQTCPCKISDPKQFSSSITNVIDALYLLL